VRQAVEINTELKYKNSRTLKLISVKETSRLQEMENIEALMST